MNKIGEGISGPVYRVKEKQTGNYFTCKILKDQYKTNREVAIHRKIKGRKLQTFYKVIQKKKKVYLLTDYIPGNDLFNEIFCPMKTLHKCIQNRIILEMSDCIEQIHNNGFVHLDIKFENFVVHKNPYHLTLIDFGCCHVLRPEMNKLQTIVGTRGYIAPELYSGQYHQNSDIWSLGICLWCMVTGQFPFSRTTFSQNPNNAAAYYVFPLPCHQKYIYLFSEQQFQILSGIFKQRPEERMNIAEIKATLQINT